MSLTVPADRDILVCVFQRGAADALNAVVPWGDGDYQTHRPNIHIPDPGQPGGAIDLDGFFGLHPALAPLQGIYSAGYLALVHATGLPHGSRSHFAAQDLVERGITQIGASTTGWLGRHLNAVPAASNSAFRAVAIAGNVPVSLVGMQDPLAISELSAFGFDDGISAGYPELLGNLYSSAIPFASTANSALAAMEELNAANIADIEPHNGVTYPETPLANKLKQAAQLIYSELPVEVICVDSDGWDHHENLPNYINLSLTELAEALAAFYDDLGTNISRVTLMVVTEFGRRVFENGSNGTDHGTGSVAYLMGGGVNGGQVFANWPGLEVANLALGEDLAISTDIRSVILELLNKRLGGTNQGIVFPGYSGPVDNNLFAV